eukprot:4959409-Prymnesium_polylepis.1
MSRTSASESAKSCQAACFNTRSDEILWCAAASGASGSRFAEASCDPSLRWAFCSCGPRTSHCIVAAIRRLTDASAAASAWLIMPLIMRTTSSATSVSLAIDECVRAPCLPVCGAASVK